MLGYFFAGLQPNVCQGGSGVVSWAETVKKNTSTQVSNGMESIARMRAPTNTQGSRTKNQEQEVMVIRVLEIGELKISHILNMLGEGKREGVFMRRGLQSWPQISREKLMGGGHIILAKDEETGEMMDNRLSEVGKLMIGVGRKILTKIVNI